MCSLWGCALFKKTSRSSSQNSHISNHQLEASQLVLKSADRETQVFTYWNDSGFYQYQHIKERVDQAETGKVMMEERNKVEQKNVVKTKEPVYAWMYIGIIVLFGVGFLIYRWWKVL